MSKLLHPHSPPHRTKGQASTVLCFLKAVYSPATAPTTATTTTAPTMIRDIDPASSVVAESVDAKQDHIHNHIINNIVCTKGF